MMKNIYLAVIISVLTFTSNAQSEVPSMEGKFSAGLFYSFDSNYSSDVNFDESTGYFADYNKDNFSTGLIVFYGLTRKLGLSSGVNYSEKSFTGEYYCHVCDFVMWVGYEPIDLQFIEVPLTAKYYFLLSKINLFSEAGVTNIFQLDKNKEPVLFNGTYSLSGRIGGGIEYQFFEDYSLQMTVRYSQNISKFFDQEGYDYKVLGISLGIIREF